MMRMCGSCLSFTGGTKFIPELLYLAPCTIQPHAAIEGVGHMNHIEFPGFTVCSLVEEPPDPVADPGTWRFPDGRTLANFFVAGVCLFTRGDWHRIRERDEMNDMAAIFTSNFCAILQCPVCQVTHKPGGSKTYVAVYQRLHSIYDSNAAISVAKVATRLQERLFCRTCFDNFVAQNCTSWSRSTTCALPWAANTRFDLELVINTTGLRATDPSTGQVLGGCSPDDTPMTLGDVVDMWLTSGLRDVLSNYLLGSAIQQTGLQVSEKRTAASGQMSSRMIRGCGLPSCTISGHGFQVCGNCKTIAYSCREHRRKDWKRHKCECKELPDSRQEAPIKRH